MNSTLSWTAVLNQNGGWRLGAHQGSLHYTAPDRGCRQEKMQGERIWGKMQWGSLLGGGLKGSRWRDLWRCVTKWMRGGKRGRGVERETSTGSGTERGMERWKERKGEKCWCI